MVRTYGSTVACGRGSGAPQINSHAITKRKRRNARLHRVATARVPLMVHQRLFALARGLPKSPNPSARARPPRSPTDPANQPQAKIRLSARRGRVDEWIRRGDRPARPHHQSTTAPTPAGRSADLSLGEALEVWNRPPHWLATASHMSSETEAHGGGRGSELAPRSHDDCCLGGSQQPCVRARARLPPCYVRATCAPRTTRSRRGVVGVEGRGERPSELVLRLSSCLVVQRELIWTGEP